MIAQAKKHIEYLVNKTKYLTFVFCDLSKFRLFFRLFFMHCFTLLQIMELLPEEDPNYLNSIQRLQNKYLKNLNIYIFEISNYPPNIEQLFCLEAIVYTIMNSRINMTHRLVESEIKVLQYQKF